MTGSLDADDLALLVDGFTAAMVGSPGAGAADGALFGLGWADLLAEAPVEGAAMAFTTLGSTGSAACLLDDVLAVAFGLTPGPDVCIALPSPHDADPPGRFVDGCLVLAGLVSARIEHATELLIPIAEPSVVGRVRCTLVALSADQLRTSSVADAVDLPRVTFDGGVPSASSVFGAGPLSAVPVSGPGSAADNGLDPDRPFRRISVVLDARDIRVVEAGVDWEVAVTRARAALAHQLIGASRGMLTVARQHALDRVQFGRPIASFQAVRHKLAESLAAIEGAAAVADSCTVDSDSLLAAVAKSLAGKAARTTATHAQQVLAGIGFTTNHDFHRSLKRTLVIDTLFGSARTLPTEIGRSLLARRDAPRLVEL